MTKNYRQCVNTMCKRFINICQAYPCINTSMHTSRPLKSADKSDGLTYKKSQPGRPPCLARLNPAGGLDDQAGPKGRIPPGPNSQRLPTSPPVDMGAEVIPVCVSPIWVDISPTGVHKDIETSSGDVEADGYSSDRIPRRYTDHAPLKGGAITDNSPGVSDVQSLGADSQQGKISAHSEAGVRVPGVPGELNLPIPGPPIQEDEEDSTECLGQQLVSRRDIARFVGKASASTRAIWQAPLHYRALQSMINSVAQQSNPG